MSIRQTAARRQLAQELGFIAIGDLDGREVYDRNHENEAKAHVSEAMK